MATATETMQRWFVAITNRTDDRGASLVEYALLVALIALICFAAVGFLGESTNSNIEGVGSSLTSAN